LFARAQAIFSPIHAKTLTGALAHPCARIALEASDCSNFGGNRHSGPALDSLAFLSSSRAEGEQICDRSRDMVRDAG
jgi:hypothetical protein